MTPYASRHFGFLVTHPDVLPYFARAAILALPKEDREKEYAWDDVEKAELNIEDFAKMLAETPAGKRAADESCLYDEDLLEDFWEELNHEIEITGKFQILEAGIPKDAPEGSKDIEIKFDCETAITIALDNQPTSLFMQCYKTYTQVEAEIRDKLKAMNVEFPENFPYWRYIGLLDGVVYDDD